MRGEQCDGLCQADDDGVVLLNRRELPPGADGALLAAAAAGDAAPGICNPGLPPLPPPSELAGMGERYSNSRA